MGVQQSKDGLQKSKDELLYNQVIDGNVEAIRALCREGAGLENCIMVFTCISWWNVMIWNTKYMLMQWIDKVGKTPLILACMSPERFIVAETLIELGANVNAYRPGGHAGTPLHHAAKKGLDQTVKLLLSHGANPLVRNDDCHTPLDFARIKGSNSVVRTIENHICFFSGWLREFYGPVFLEALAPQLLSTKIWVVIIPCGPHNPKKPLKLELVIYSTLQDVLPRTVIALWKAYIEEPKFHQSDPGLIIFDKSTKTLFKFASASDGDKQQLQWLYNACRGIPQVMPLVPHDYPTSVPTTATQTATEAIELAMAINASIGSAMEGRLPLVRNNHLSSEANNANGWGDMANDSSHNGWGSFGGPTPSEPGSSGWKVEPAKEGYNGWGVPESRPTSNPIQHTQTPNNIAPIVQTSNAFPVLVSAVPSAPLVPTEFLDEGLIHYPSIDFSPVDLSIPSIDHRDSKASEAKDESGSSSCVICWEAPVEGACIPCGHMAGCMTCLNEIRTKKGVCPVCRAKIDQVIRLYAV